MAGYIAALVIAGAALTSIAACGKDAAPKTTAPPTPNVEPVATRGTFGAASCDASARVAVPDTAAFAVYFDQEGNEIESSVAENLAGTSDKMMCPLSPAPDQSNQLDPGICTPLCSKVVSKKTYCVPCS
jgi:hypothetical protein